MTKYQAIDRNGDVFARGSTRNSMEEMAIDRLLTHSDPTQETLELYAGNKYLGIFKGVFNKWDELELKKIKSNPRGKRQRASAGRLPAVIPIAIIGGLVWWLGKRI